MTDWNAVYERGPVASAASYPYDQRADATKLEALDKLRAVEDRHTAQNLYLLWFHAERNERDPEYHKRRAREEQAKERERLLLMAHACFEGRRGKEARELAEFCLYDEESGKRRSDLESLRVFERQFTELKQARRNRSDGNGKR
jgi:hypothetical protein